MKDMAYFDAQIAALRSEMQDLVGGQAAGLGPMRVIGGGGSGRWATDYVIVGGHKLAIPENTNDYDILKVYLNGTTAPEWVAAMPETPDADAEYYDMSTAPHIQLPGNFA